MSWSKKMFNEREDEQLSVWSYYINIIFVCLLYITLLQLLNSWNVSFIILFDFQRIDWYIWDLILSLKILSGRQYGNMMHQLVLLLTWQMNLNVTLDLLSPHIPLVRKFFVYFLYSAIWGYLFPACLLLDTIVDEESIYLTGEAGERDLSTCSSPHPKSLVIETSQVFLVVASESFCKEQNSILPDSILFSWCQYNLDFMCIPAKTWRAWIKFNVFWLNLHFLLFISCFLTLLF